MIRNICGNDPSLLRSEIVTGLSGPDVSHRANFRRVCGTFILIGVVVLGAACSSRVVYEARSDFVTAPNVFNINTASVDELERLPHIGRKTAEAIVAFRNENGPFRRPEHLLQIHGVSEARFADIRQSIRTD